MREETLGEREVDVVAHDAGGDEQRQRERGDATREVFRPESFDGLEVPLAKLWG